MAKVKEKVAKIPKLPAWIESPQIKELLEQGQEEGSLDTERISVAFNQALKHLKLDSQEANFEDLMGIIAEKKIAIADLADDEILDYDGIQEGNRENADQGVE